MRNTADLHLVDVMIGPRCIVILPDREVELGNLGSDEMIHLACRNTAAGVVFDASKIKRTPAAADALDYVSKPYVSQSRREWPVRLSHTT